MIEINNRKANFDYEILDTYETGIVLTGTEIKSIREGKANLKDSYAIVRNDELWLVNMHINSYKQGSVFNHLETRSRKLLAHKKEIKKLMESTQTEGFTLVPLKLYFKRSNVKILIGVGKGKKLYDKRESIKKKDMQRDLEKSMKDRSL